MSLSPPPADLAALPKAHLHLHFTGSMRHSTLIELADARGIHLPPALLEEHVPHLEPTERGWFRFQRLYDAARAAVRTTGDMERIVMEAAEDNAAEGVRWLEIQIDPTSYARIAGTMTDALELVLDVSRTASEQTGCQVVTIVAANRTRHPFDARALARLAAQYAGDTPGSVVGFGLSNDERRGITKEFAPAFEIARRAGLTLVPHSGELLGPDHISATLRHLRPDRLGHGVRSVEDPELLAELVDAGVVLEVCPLSNVSLGVYATNADVPLRTLLEAGAKVALGADDPLLFGSSLLDSYRLAYDEHGFTRADLAQWAICSLEGSTAPRHVVAEWSEEAQEWRDKKQNACSR